MALLVNDTAPRKQYTATASQTVFAYPFAIFEDADLKVYHTLSGVDADDATDIQTLTTHYTISGAASTSGGNVTLVTGAAVGDVITIERDVAVKRVTDYQNLGDLSSASFNDDLDKIIMMVQQNETEITRTFKLQRSDSTVSDLNLPISSAGKSLIWNGSATGLENGPSPTAFGDGEEYIVDSIAGLRTVSDRKLAFVRGYYTNGDGGGGDFYWDSTSTETDNGGTIIKATAVTTGRWKRLYSGAVNVKWFGAKGDSSTDDTVAIQAALDAAGAQTYKGAVYFPTGNYLIDVTTASITLPEGTGIIGDGVYQPISTTMYGATFYIKGTANDAFVTTRGNQIQGVNFYYPDQVTTNPPTAYGWTIRQDTTAQNAQGLDINDCVFINPYKGINLAGSEAGFVAGSSFLSKIRMTPLNTGIELGHSPVNIWMNQIVMTAEFWSASVGQPVRDYMAQTSVGIHVIASDSLHVSQFTAFGLQACVKFSGGSDTNVDFCHFQGCIFDGSRYGIRMETGTTVQTLKLTGCDFLAKQQDDTTVLSEGLSISGTALVDKVMAAACYWGPTNGTHIVLTHPSGVSIGYYNFSACQFENAGSAYTGGSAVRNITVNSTSAVVTLTNCHFKNLSGDTVTCIKTFAVKLLKLIGCHFNLQEFVLDFAGTDLTMIGNSSEGTVGSTATPTLNATGRIIDDNNNWDKTAASPLFAASGTPTVKKGSIFTTAAANTYTDFLDAYEGKRISVLAKHTATISNNANIKTSTGANKVMVVDVVYPFISIGGVWYEQTTT